MGTEILNLDAKRVHRWLTFIICTVALLRSCVGDEQDFIGADNVCSCPNDVLTYTCTVVGGVATVWSGSAFDCQTGGIVLPHIDFGSRGTSGSCNNGAIVGQSVEVVDDCYTSELNVTLNSEINNKTIQCQGVSVAGRATISIIPVVPPISVSLTGVNRGNLTFNWTPGFSGCSQALTYQITFDCGSCPSMTQATSATCSVLQLSSSERLCTFTIQSVCRTFVGNQSISFGVTLKAPDIPDVKITPLYNAETRILSRIDFEIREEAPFTITSGIFSSIESYNISYYYDGDDVSTSVRNLSSNSVIEFQISDCPRNNISVIVSAISNLGEGQSSIPYTTGCNNIFAEVKYIAKNSSISCMFRNKSDTSNKSCVVRYGQCNELNQNRTGYSISDTILVNLDIDPYQSYCYEVTASSDVDTVTVEGEIVGIDRRDIVSIVAAAVVVPLVLVLVCLLLLVIVVLVIKYLLSQRTHKGTSDTSAQTENIELIGSEKTPSTVSSPAKATVLSTEATVTQANTSPKALSDEPSATKTNKNDCNVPSSLLPPSNKDTVPLSQPTDSRLIQKFTEIIVDEDCELRECVRETFKRGCAYYKICPEGEIVFEDQELIRMKGNGYYTYSIPDRYKVQLGQGMFVKPPSDYQVFAQCVGSGARYLPAKSSILLHKMSDEQPYDIKKLSWRTVISDQFQVLNVQDNVKLSAFRRKYNLSPKRGNIFLDFKTFFKEGGPINDVILMSKASSVKYSGPKVRHMIQQYYQKLKRESSIDQHFDDPAVKYDADADFELLDEVDAHDISEWKVFILTELKRDIQFQAGVDILYQDKHNQILTFVVLEVDENNVQMRKFVEKELEKLEKLEKIDTSFENGAAFYRLPDEGEDLLYYKDVLYPDALDDKRTGEKLPLRVQIEGYYALGAPGEKIKSSAKNVYIQSNSSGSRCLKKGAKILYKINDEPHRQ